MEEENQNNNNRYGGRDKSRRRTTSVCFDFVFLLLSCCVYTGKDRTDRSDESVA